MLPYGDEALDWSDWFMYVHLKEEVAGEWFCRWWWWWYYYYHHWRGLSWNNKTLVHSTMHINYWGERCSPTKMMNMHAVSFLVKLLQKGKALRRQPWQYPSPIILKDLCVPWFIIELFVKPLQGRTKPWGGVDGCFLVWENVFTNRARELVVYRSLFWKWGDNFSSVDIVWGLRIGCAHGARCTGSWIGVYEDSLVHPS